MSITKKHLKTAPAAVLAAASIAAMAGCGDDSTEAPPASVKSGQIASIGTEGAGVDKARFERFLSAQLKGNGPLGASVAGSIPLDPPSYSRCMAAVAANGAKSKAPKPTREQLLSSCRASYEQARGAVEGQLITYNWLLQEGKAKGIELTPAEIDQSLRQFMAASASTDGKQASPAEAKAHFDAALKRSHLTLDDFKLQLEAQAIQQKLAAKAADGATGKELARKQIEFLNALQHKWRAGTLCLKGYVVAQCSNGPKLADLQPPK